MGTIYCGIHRVNNILGYDFGFAYYRFKKFIRRRHLLKKVERRRSRKSSESSISNGPGMRARRSSEMVG